MTEESREYTHPLNRKKVENPPKKGVFNGNICQDCGLAINRYNTAAARGRVGGCRCGKCYLKWKAAERKRKGER